MRAIALGGIEPTKEPKKPRKKRKPVMRNRYKMTPIPVSSFTGPAMPPMDVPVAYHYNMTTSAYPTSSYQPSSYSGPLAGVTTGPFTLSGTWNPSNQNLMQSNLRQRVQAAKEQCAGSTPTKVILGRLEQTELDAILAADLGLSVQGTPQADYPYRIVVPVNVCALRVVRDNDAETRLEVG